MCENHDKLIQVEEKTDKGKYEFLRAYFPVWNFIIKSGPRAIIDTHAGTGLVEYKKFGKKIYGSALLALIKTVTISKDLKIIINEKNPKNFQTLKEEIEKLKTQGVRAFEPTIKKMKQKKLNSKRTRKVKPKKKIKKRFPDKPSTQCPKNFHEVFIKSRAEIIYYNDDISNSINEILRNDLPDYEYSKNGDIKREKTKTLFLVDPCGRVEWSIIDKIGQRANLEEGTELILNWSYDAISRNKPLPFFKRILSEIYGIPIDDIQKEFNGVSKRDQYLDKYIQQLHRYWKFIETFGIPRSMKLTPKKKHRTYFLIFCTNNSSGISIASNALKKINKVFRGGFMDIEEFIENLNE